MQSEEDIRKHQRDHNFSSTTKIITGTYLDNYLIPSIWSNRYKEKSPALKTIDGIFLLSKFDLYKYNFKEGQKITISVGRFDLIDWKLIKE